MSDMKSIVRPRIAFVCVNYNNAVRTAQLVVSVMSQSKNGIDFDADVIIVDNASDDEDLNELRSIMSISANVRLVRAKTNIGYFGGLNLGISALPTSELAYVVIGNNDLTFASDFCEKLVKKNYPRDVLVVAPSVVAKDGFHQNPHCIERVSSIRKLLYDIYFSNYFAARMLVKLSRLLTRIRGGRSNQAASHPQYIHMGIGACYVLTPNFFRHFHRLDDRVFLYGEEALLAGQVMSVEGRTFYDPDLIVHHDESATLSKVPTKKVYDFAKRSYPIYKEYL